MKKKILTLFMATAFGSALMAQTQVMNVYKTDGSKLTYKVAEVERVLFEEEQQELTLNNQYAHNTDVKDIKSVVVYESEGYYMAAFYESEGVTSLDDAEEFDPVASVAVKADQLGQEVSLSGQDAIVMTGDHEFSEIQGTLKVAFDRMKKNITVSLNATEADTEAGEHNVRIEYNGEFAQTYYTSDELVISDAEGEELVDQYISSVLRQQPAETGGSTVFGFGDKNASTAEGFLDGKYGVQFSVAASKLNSTIDLATETGSYTFKLIDYTTGTVDESVASGTITTDDSHEGKVYILLNVTMESGVTVQFDYFEEVTGVTDLTPMIPSKKYGNEYIYYNADGEESIHKTISTLKYKTGAKYTTFYFVADGESDSSSPQLQINPELIGTGTIDLANLKAGDQIKIKYQDIGLQSPENEWVNVPNNGTLNISKDESGNYDISLEVQNHYNCTGSNITNGGTDVKLVIAYRGVAVAK